MAEKQADIGIAVSVKVISLLFGKETAAFYDGILCHALLFMIK